MQKYSLEKYLLPIWEGDTIYNETVLFVGEEDVAPLLYPIKEVISVYDYGLQTEYFIDKDFIIVDGKIQRVKDGNMPYIPVDEYYLSEPAQFSISIVNRNETAPKDKKYFSFGEKDTFTKHQIAITYKHDLVDKVQIPPCKKQKLVNFYNKIQEKKPITVIFYGDSITMGCNSSGTPMGGETFPFADKFSVMVAKQLQKEFSLPINHINVAVGGWSSKNGIDNFNEKVLPYESDLMILGFGMNDGRTPPEEYYKNVEEIIIAFRAKNPKSEIVLLSTTYPNTESDWVKNQPILVNELKKLEEKYNFTVLVDMTKMHENLLSCGKRYRDMTGNNVNHPNDFLARIYAQVILRTIIG